MNYYFGIVLLSVALISCTNKVDNPASKQAINYPYSNNGEITAELILEIVDIEFHDHYPVGLGVRYRFKNNSDRKLFINFQPVYLNSLKDSSANYFFKQGAYEAIVPSEIRVIIDSLQCNLKPKAWLQEKLYDSLFQKEVPFEQAKVGDQIFCRSFLFLDPGETFECTNSITSILFRNKKFVDKGLFTFFFAYDGLKDTLLSGNSVPDQFYGYKRYKGKVLSNPIYLNIR